MPEFEKIGNDGKPTGEKRNFNYNEAAKLRRIKNSRWKELPGEKPKISRSNPIEGTDKNIELVKSFPTKVGDQIRWVKETNDLERLEAAKQLADNKTVLNAIDSKITALKNSDGNDGSDK